MYSYCKDCGQVLRDYGSRPTIICHHCGASNGSREWEGRESHEPFEIVEDSQEARYYDEHPLPGAPYQPLPPPPPTYPGYYYPPYYPGHYQPTNLFDVVKKISRFICMLGTMLFILLMIPTALTLVPGVYIATPELLSPSTHISLFVALPVDPFLITYLKVNGPKAAIYFLLIVTVIIISGAWLLKNEGKEAIKVLWRCGTRLESPPKRTENSLIMIGQLFMAVLFFNYLFVFLLALFGGVPESPMEDAKLWEMFYGLANASVYEEIITRLLLIGVPLLVISLVTLRMERPWYNYLLGGNLKLSPLVIVLITASSFIFAMAHYPGWGAWKVIPTFVAGLAFGYLYARKGIAASIILHFAFDYSAMLAMLSYPSAIFVGLTLLALGFVGLIYFFHYSYRILDFFLDESARARVQG